MDARRVIKRVGLGALAVIALAVVALALSIALDPLLSSRSVEAVSNVTYPGLDGEPRYGYLAEPAGEGPHPAVLMFHEWWGLNAEIVELADRLAEEGYVVFAPDVYRGRVTASVPRALYMRLTTPAEDVAADADAAYAYLRELQAVDGARVGAVGFCFGGGVSLNLAVRQPDLAGVATLYGSLIDDPAALGALRGDGPLLGIYAEEDASIPLSEVEAFEAALEAADTAHTITVYPGVGHAFVQPEAIDEGGAAREAWQQIVAFFADTLSAES